MIDCATLGTRTLLPGGNKPCCLSVSRRISIGFALDRDSDAEDQRVARLRERLLAPAILDRHVEAYRELLVQARRLG